MSAERVGLSFDEILSGAFALGATEPEAGEQQGKAAGTAMKLAAHIAIGDVDAFVDDPGHGAALAGTLDFAPLGDAIALAAGRFELLRHSEDPKVKLMVYAAGFEHAGQRYFLEGKKFIRDSAGLTALLRQTTTLLTRLYGGPDSSAPVVGAGVLRIGAMATFELIGTMRTTATTKEGSARALGAFGSFFFGELWASYSAGLLGSPPSSPPKPPPAPGFPRAYLARPAAELADGAIATVVVIGSGYGGGVAASRLARVGQRVVVLERGKEWRAGDFPDEPLEGAAQLQVDAPEGHEGARTGLYDFRLNPQMDVLIGCGLGGTSLINAGVSLEPDPRLYDEPRWPSALRRDRDTSLAEGFGRARAMLRPAPYPATAPELAKLTALERAAEALGRPLTRPPLNVTFADGENAANVAQRACALCGDCISGCNYAAKTTVDVTYLADAKAHGAELFTEVTARWIERVGDKLRVHWRWTGADDDDALRSITADVIVVAGGALGSTELLLRSAARGLPLSPRLGRDVSSNADYLSFAYNGDRPVRGIGLGSRAADQRGPVGPTITGLIGAAPDQPLRRQFLVEEGAIPGLLAAALPGAFGTAAATVGTNTAAGLRTRLEQAGRTVLSVARGADGAFVGAVANTQTLLSIGHDDADGSMALVEDRLRIAWPTAGDQPIYVDMERATLAATAVAQGIALKEPAWAKVFRHNLITVHPLGGCPMGEDAERGVVDHRGRVFAGATGVDVHPGLYVVDGSILPTSAGVNPLLTITALAERAMTLLIEERGWGERPAGARRSSDPWW